MEHFDKLLTIVFSTSEQIKNEDEETTMANFKMDGNNMIDGSGQTVATVDGNHVREGYAGPIVGSVQGNSIRVLSGGPIVATVEGNNIRERYVGPIVATVDDVKKAIQGATGTMTDVALWWFFVRRP